MFVKSLVLTLFKTTTKGTRIVQLKYTNKFSDIALVPPVFEVNIVIHINPFMHNVENGQTTLGTP